MRFWKLAVGVSYVASLLRTNESTLLPSLAVNVLQFGTLLAVGLAGLALRREGAARLLRARSFLVPVALLVTLALTSSLLSERGTQTAAQAGIFAVVAIFLGATLTCRWADGETRDSDLRFLFWIGVTAHAVGLVGYVTAQPWAVKDFGRFGGLMFNANYAGISAALLITLAFHLRGRATIGAMVPLVALLLSGSRGALLGVLVALLVLMVLVRTSRVRLVIYAWALGLGFTFLAMARPSVFGGTGESFSRVQQGGGFFSGRIEIYAELLSRWVESPVLGIGYREAEIDKFGQGVQAGHNIYLTVLVELGVVGAIAFTVVLAQMWFVSDRRHMLIAPVVAILTIELTESSLFGFGNPVTLTAWLLFFAYVSTGPVGPTVDTAHADRSRSPAWSSVPSNLRHTGR